jgi:hypothetical protein
MMFVQSEQQNPAELSTSKPVQPAVYPAGKACMQAIDSNFLLIEPLSKQTSVCHYYI